MPDDGRRYELVEGELVVTPAPSTRHQRIVFHVAALLRRAEEAGHGKAFTAPTDVVLSPESAVQPDLLFIAAGRLGIVTEDNVQGAPDLVVEVISEATRRRDLGPKLRLYARHGVRWYWAVDPEEDVVRAYDLAAGVAEPVFLRPGQRLGCPAFPGVEADVAELLAG